MQYIAVAFDPDSLNQIVTVSGDPNGIKQTLSFALRYIVPCDCWQLTVTNADTGECICRGLTVTAAHAPVDLLAPFAYKRCGSLFVVPKVDEPDSEDPGEFNLDQFEFVWGDTYGN